MSYSREMTHADYSSMKMGDPYSIFMVGCHLTLDFYLRNRTCITPHRVYDCCFILQTCGVTVLTDAKLNQERIELFALFRKS